MRIGVPKEIKANEYRVALVPAGAAALVQHGHEVVIEGGAGEGSGFPDELYLEAGATILDTAEEVWATAEMIVKVKEPIEQEWPLIREDQLLFTYFHFAASEPLTRALMDSGSIAVAYETVQLSNGELPLLTPMSEVAGRLSILEGAKYLERFYGGRGLLLGGVPGVLPAHVVILGGGVVGTNAAKMAAGFGARVTLLDISLPRLRYLSDVMPANVNLLYSNRYNILEQIEQADLLIGGVLLPGKKAPSLVKREDLKRMLPGSVIVDVAVDQGGCVETIYPTTHENPIYEVDGVIHYAVANMPGAVARTSTLALTNATLPYAITLANKGWKTACLEDPALRMGLNVVHGEVTYEGVAEAFDMEFRAAETVLGP
ncbi:MAG: alanine dehydrogenase [Gemmatimonadales bacterium]|nr:MAG: alanine dehydrogenase [Gemmatimonadales bacterium]